jgi:hypothetical protein
VYIIYIYIYTIILRAGGELYRVYMVIDFYRLTGQVIRLGGRSVGRSNESIELIRRMNMLNESVK